ncbi:unnamed protein product [Amoebophrya sp. A120]|nr:unnamed protein product [Amoebophrya sp. A120]|eukprot:GSA120T00002849001.1
MPKDTTTMSSSKGGAPVYLASAAENGSEPDTATHSGTGTSSGSDAEAYSSPDRKQNTFYPPARGDDSEEREPLTSSTTITSAATLSSSFVAGGNPNDQKLKLRNFAAPSSPTDDEKERADYAEEVLFKPFRWLSDLNELYGFRLLFMLFVAQHIMKGFAGTFVGQPERFIYKSYHISGPQVQIYMGVSGLPWALKPIFGLLSDLVPINGYNKRPYILGASFLGVTSMLFLAFLEVPVTMIVMFFFCIALQRSVCDLLTEAKYAEALKKKPEHGPDLMTFVWGGIEMFGLIALMCVGPLVEWIGPRKPYLLLMPFASLILYPTYKNYLDETKRPAAETQAHRKKLVTENKEVFMLCILITICTLCMTVSGTLFTSVRLHALTALVVLVVILFSFSVILRPEIAKMNAFYVLQGSLSIGIGGASFYFFTDGPKEYPTGPHFSTFFFVTVLGVTGTLCSLCGLWFYNRFLKNYSYITLLTLTNLLGVALSILDIAIFTRSNVAWGISDHLFVMGGTVSASLIGNWQWMPGVVMLSQMCPRNMEATLYALLAGCHNLGNSISEYLGAFVLEELGCTPTGQGDETTKFDNLWVAALIQTVVPMFTIALIPYMIPNNKQTDTILVDAPDSATKGSLYSKWFPDTTGYQQVARMESQSPRSSGDPGSKDSPTAARGASV